MDNFRWASPSRWLLPLRPSPRPSPPFRFLDLPTELRYMIYAQGKLPTTSFLYLPTNNILVIQSKADLRLGYTDLHQSPNPSISASTSIFSWYVNHGALPRVSRQIRAEFNEAQSLNLPSEIRVDIRDAKFVHLRQFGFRPIYWRRYLEYGTRIRVVLHYNPSSSDEAYQWGIQLGRISAPFLQTTRFEISYEVVVHQTTFFQQILRDCPALRDWLATFRKILHLPQPTTKNIGLSYDQHLDIIDVLRQPWSWNTTVLPQHVGTMQELYKNIDMAMREARGPPIVVFCRRAVSFTINTLLSSTFHSICVGGAWWVLLCNGYLFRFANSPEFQETMGVCNVP